MRLQYRSSSADPHTQLTRELVGSQIQIWLLEVRQADVRTQLRHCRTRRAGLGRTYRRLIQQTDRRITIPDEAEPEQLPLPFDCCPRCQHPATTTDYNAETNTFICGMCGATWRRAVDDESRL